MSMNPGWSEFRIREMHDIVGKTKNKISAQQEPHTAAGRQFIF